MNSALITAVRGPIMLIAVGTLFAMDHAGSFRVQQSWPVLLVLYGALRLLERAVAPPPPPPPPYSLPPQPPPFRQPTGGGF